MSNQEIWFSPAPNTNGIGTQALPYDGSTSAKIDAILGPLSGSMTPNVVVRFTEGTYLVSANPYKWGPSTNWAVIGSGPGTVLKTDPGLIHYTGTSQIADSRCILFEGGLGGVTVRDITLDGSASDMGSQLAATASMVAVGANLSVTVKSAAIFAQSIGKWIVLEDSAATNGVNLIYGSFVLNSISGNTLNLTATTVSGLPTCMAAGTAIPATTYALVLVHSSGFNGGRAGDTLENVTIQNVCNYTYEGPCGIFFQGYGGQGGTIKDCVIKNVWGFSSWHIALNGCKGISITGCTVMGNGHSQAFSLMNLCDEITATGNFFTGTAAGAFGDTGTFTRITLSENNIEATYPVQFYATVERLSLLNNNLTIIGTGGQVAIGGYWPTTNSKINGNTVEFSAGATSVWGLNAANGTGNEVNDNQFAAGLTLSVTPTFGVRSGNMQGGVPVVI